MSGDRHEEKEKAFRRRRKRKCGEFLCRICWFKKRKILARGHFLLKCQNSDAALSFFKHLIFTNAVAQHLTHSLKMWQLYDS